MRLSYLGKLPLFFTLGIDMRQFLLGTVQLDNMEIRNLVTLLKSKCQFLLGTVQLSDTTKGAKFLGIVSIPLRYGRTFTEISS